MTTKEAAELLGITPVAVRYLIEQGILKAEKRGRDWWITPAAVEAARQRRRPGRPAQEGTRQRKTK